VKILTSLYQKLTLGSGIICIEEYKIRESLCNLLLLSNITKIIMNHNSYITHFSSQLCLDHCSIGRACRGSLLLFHWHRGLLPRKFQ
jgi:hypothetical protein